MKYDRPVWQIMHQCADAMDTSVRYEDVRDWFFTYYPAVNEATIRAHLIGLTEGGRAKHVQFAQRSPVFRRVSRGEYSPIPKAERGEDPNKQSPSASRLKMFRSATAVATPDADREASGKVGEPVVVLTSPAPAHTSLRASSTQAVTEFDLILLGSLGHRLSVPAPAKEAFRGLEFQMGRAEAEESGLAWFALSAEHGLMMPDEWISPQVHTLADLDPARRQAWGAWVTARLESFVGPLAGKRIRIDAPDLFVDPLLEPLQSAGAVVSASNVAPLIPRRDETPQSRRAQDAPTDAVCAHLSDRDQAISPADLLALPDEPGLYGWCVDQIGAQMLNRSLRLPVRAGLIFIGQIAAPDTLRDQLGVIQLHGRVESSKFRRILAAALYQRLDMSSPDDRVLSKWMQDHLTVTVWPVADLDSLLESGTSVIAELRPVLNSTQFEVSTTQQAWGPSS